MSLNERKARVCCKQPFAILAFVAADFAVKEYSRQLVPHSVFSIVAHSFYDIICAFLILIFPRTWGGVAHFCKSRAVTSKDDYSKEQGIIQ
jgi:hypothetical protein